MTVNPAARSSLLAAVLVVAIAIGYVTPRMLELDRVMTVDESFWVGFSANFYEGLANGHFEDTYQYAYPGVPVMWAGALGFMAVYPEYPDEHPGQIGKHYAVHEDLLALDRNAADLLMAGRVIKLLMQTVLFGVGVYLAQAVFGRLTGSLGAILVAFDPFLIGHDRLLHADGFAAIASWVSLLALLRYVSDRNRRGALWLSGAVAALAWLTRAQLGVLAVVAAGTLVAIAVHAWRRGRPARQAATGAGRALAIWLASAFATTILLWPALWVAPGMVIRRMYEYSREAALVGHEAGIFFNGSTHRGDPGALYYPVAILWRMTPVSTIGVALVLFALAVGSRTLLPPHWRLPVAVLGGFAGLYLLGMTPGAKKFDRYILTVFPALDMIAAVGLVGFGKWIAARATRWTSHGLRAVIAGAVGIQIVSAISMAPYYLPYFNPLVGGTASAERMLLLGWGEGLDQSAAFILDQPGGNHAVVHTSNARVSLIYLMPTTVTVETHAYRTDMASIVQWANADYYVAYVSQWQRGYFSRPIDYLSQFKPLHTVTFGSVDFARTYDLNAIPPPSEMVYGHNCSFALGDQLQLVAYEDVRLDPAEGHNRHDISLHFVSLPETQAAYEVRLELVPTVDGVAPVSQTATLTPSPEPGMLSEVVFDVELSGKRTVKSYTVAVTVLDPATGAPIPSRQEGTGTVGTQAIMAGCD